MKEFDNTQKVVEHLLRTFPQTRDCDRKLLARCWAEAIGEDTLKEMNAYDFMVLFVTKKKLPTPATLIRVRRKLQEKFPELQGKTYVARKKRAENVRQYYSPKNNLFD